MSWLLTITVSALLSAGAVIVVVRRLGRARRGTGAADLARKNLARALALTYGRERY